MAGGEAIHAGRVDGRTAWCVRAAFGCCMAFVFLVMHLGISPDVSVYRAMLNNMALAYLPVEMSLHISRRSPAPVFWMLFAMWTIFYPNAPYVLTDYFHLAMVDPYVVLESGRRSSVLRPDLRLWMTFTVLSVSALVSALFGTWSLDRVVSVLQARIGRIGFWWRFVLVAALASLSSIGIYFGRCPRLQSVDLLLLPRHALGQMVGACSLNLAEFVVLLTIVQMVIWCWMQFTRIASADHPAATPTYESENEPEADGTIRKT